MEFRTDDPLVKPRNVPGTERKYHFNVYESMHELAAHVKEWDHSINQKTDSWYPKPGGHLDHWVGRKFNSWDDVQANIEMYWPEGMKVYQSIIEKLRDVDIPQPKSLKRELVWSDEDGFDLDLDRLQRGQQFWRASRRHHRPGPMSYTIVTDITTSASVDSMDILWRGAASVCLTEILERAGYRVELWVMQHCVNTYTKLGSTGQCTAVRLKRGSDPLDASSLINATSGWAYRTLFFGAYWIGGDIPYHGLGTINPIDTMVPAITPDENVCLVKRIFSQREAVQLIQTQIQKLK